ncbi:MAG TPA: AAA family ATPase [Armatimonadetes bacterium]|nr:AAA family ATPase [Armatimonadota bacterium]
MNSYISENFPSFAQVRERVEGACRRINALVRTLNRFYVGKEEVIELMALCTVAQEPLLLVGPPGTAKSDLVVKFCEALGLAEEDYFEYMLTKFTEPSEILGPIDIAELKEGHYLRRVQGKLPTAKIVFLDEIFKSNSAILNTLLTILNERKFYQDGRPVPVEMVMLFAATNTVPEFSEMDALKDRFVFKVECAEVRARYFEELVDKGVMHEMYCSFRQRPWTTDCTLEDFLTVKTYLDYLISGHSTGEGSETALSRDRARYFPPPVFDLFRRMLTALEEEELIVLSDRKVIKLYRLLRTRAFLLHGGEVRPEDLRLLKHIGEREEHFGLLRERVERMLQVG